MVFIIFCFLVHWAKVAPALEGLSMDQFHRAYNTYHYPGESIDRLQHSFNTGTVLGTK